MGHGIWSSLPSLNNYKVTTNGKDLILKKLIVEKKFAIIFLHLKKLLKNGYMVNICSFYKI